MRLSWTRLCTYLRAGDLYDDDESLWGGLV